jgi:hypothetical protein
MITFKLEAKTAEAMLSILNAVQPHATFVQDLNTQFFEQTVVDVIVAPVVEEVVAEEVVEEVVEEATAKKAK